MFNCHVRFHEIHIHIYNLHGLGYTSCTSGMVLSLSVLSCLLPGAIVLQCELYLRSYTVNLPGAPDFGSGLCKRRLCMSGPSTAKRTRLLYIQPGLQNTTTCWYTIRLQCGQRMGGKSWKTSNNTSSDCVITTVKLFNLGMRINGCAHLSQLAKMQSKIYFCFFFNWRICDFIESISAILWENGLQLRHFSCFPFRLKVTLCALCQIFYTVTHWTDTGALLCNLACT